MPLLSGRLTPATLRHQIAQKIREAILGGSLQPGEKLVERALASELGASLTAVREAVIQLESEGLITKRPNSATYVTSLTPEQVEQTFAVRRVLESYALQEAARHATPADVERLEGLYAAALAAARQGDPVAYIQADLAWHESAWAMSRNECLMLTLRRLIVPLFGFSAIRVATSEGFDLMSDAKLHRPIVDAIAEKDSVAAKRAFQDASRTWFSQIAVRRNG